MIRNEQEYQVALRRLAEDDQFAEAQRRAFVEAGLTPEEVERALKPTLAFHAQLQEEIDWYQRVKQRDFEALRNLAGLGRLLIALRIANGLTQKELAGRLGVSEAQVSRDERNEYHGITVERSPRVCGGGATSEAPATPPSARFLDLGRGRDCPLAPLALLQHVLHRPEPTIEAAIHRGGSELPADERFSPSDGRCSGHGRSSREPLS